ncbi:MAG: hypothetical protein RI571_15735 [Roseovarius sp.]|nr:hypothetical protein [Roseovarius sp.]
MSDTDSFIDEVTEEVRRDRLYSRLRRYGWIGVVAVLLIVGGAGWNEWRKAQETEAARALGDSMLAALQQEDAAARADALAGIEAPGPASRAVLDMLAAAERTGTAPEAAAERLLALADRDGIAPIYRQIATLKAAGLPDGGLDPETRRSRLEGIALSSGLTGLLADEQLAYLDIEAGDTEAALERLQTLVAAAQATAGLRQRASQAIVAIGGEPEGPPQEAQ